MLYGLFSVAVLTYFDASKTTLYGISSNLSVEFPTPAHVLGPYASE